MKRLKRIVGAALDRVPPEVYSQVFKHAKRLPVIRHRIEREYDKMLAEVEAGLKPYRGDLATYSQLPQRGVSREGVLSDLRAMSDAERDKWQSGHVSGAVYHGDAEHIDFLNRVYSMHSQSNPLHADVWPSAVKFESEIVSMVADMLGAEAAREQGDDVRGVVTSGGTESIMLAMKAYRDFYRKQRGILTPEIIVADTAHAAFNKASEAFGIKKVNVPVAGDYCVDVAAMAQAVTRNTICLVASAPAFPHGVIDPVPQVAELAEQADVGLHVDACLGGFVLPWAKQLGYPVPKFDFRVPSVTSISVDTHKYGYAPKGTSVILYRSRELIHEQYFVATDWPGGLYFSPTFAGSRPGALSAACWAALVSIGAEGYRAKTQEILETADKIRRGIEQIEELYVLGNPLWVIAFASEAVDIYRVMDHMASRGWSLNGLHKPACVHLCVTLRHTRPGVAEAFLADLQAAVQAVKTSPRRSGGMAPIYGLAGTLPFRGAVADLLKRYVDLLYKV